VTTRRALFAVICLASALARAQAPTPAPEAPESVPASISASDAPPEPERKIVVTGTRTPRRTSRDPVGTESIGAKELEARNVRDASRVLDAEPGVQAERSFRGASVQMRGLEAKYVRILLDSMPLVGQVNDVIDLRRYSLEGIERVEVVRGAASALYGSDALAGVVNFISRRPVRPVEASGFAQYGMLNSSAAGLYAGTKRGSLGATLTLNWFGNDSYDLTPGDEDLSTSGDARRAISGTVRGFWTPREGLEVMGFLRVGGFDTRGVDLQPPRALWNRRVNEAEYAGGGTLHWTTRGGSRLTVLLQGNAFDRTFWRQQRQGPGLDDMKSLETLWRGEAQLDRKVTSWLTVAAGSGGQRAQLESPRLTGGAALAAAGWSYAQGEIGLGAFGDLVVGARLDVDRDFGSHASPRIALRLTLPGLPEGLALRAAYGQGFRAPSLGERYLAFKNNAANYVVQGNSALRPELSHSSQAGLEWAPPAKASPGWLPTVRLTAYRNDLVGLVQPVDLSGSLTYFQYQNYSTARVQGLEASVRAQSRWLVADLGYAWLDARGVLDGVEQRLPGRASRQLTASLIARSSEWGTELSIRGQYQRLRTPLDPAMPGWAPDLVLVDAKLGQRVWRAAQGSGELQAYVSCDNLANATDPGFLSLPGRVVLAGLQARY
jgi:outer membrane receptor for ferrienterochelin and colicins